MKALKIGADNNLDLVEIDDPQPGVGEVRVKLKAAAINKRDYWISVGKYPSIRPGTTLGSDGAGIVDALGETVSKTWLDKAVIINPNISWGENPEVQGKEYSILGMPKDGTLAEYVVVKADRLSALPPHLGFEEGAALPLAGLTAFRAVFHHGKVAAGTSVLISGFGGGVAHFAFLFSKAANAKVSITTGNDFNIKKAKELGAEFQFNYKDTDWIAHAVESARGFDVIIDSAGGDQFNSFIKILNPAGRIVFYGASNGLPSSLDLYRLFWKQGTIQGTTMGNDEEFEAMVRFVEENQITPLISKKYPFEQVAFAVKQIQHAHLPGKSIIVF